MKPIAPPGVSLSMFAFLDFEASSLNKHSYPIEVAWVFEDGTSESHLIRPAPQWTDWDAEAEAVHRIPRAQIERQGKPHDEVARRMVDQLSHHDLFASAPSWDGKWLSALLRAAKLPRHVLRVRDTEEARVEVARRILAPFAPAERLHIQIADVLARVDDKRKDGRPSHRALPDAEGEYQHWLSVVAEAEAAATRTVRV